MMMIQLRFLFFMRRFQMNSLQEFLDEKEGINEAFEVVNESEANWALRKIKEKQQEIDKNNQLAQSEIDKIEQWESQVRNTLQNDIDYFQGLLAKYAMALKENDPKFKSLKLPNGNLQFRKQQPKWHYDDKELVSSLKELGMTDYIKTEEKPVKKDIKQALTVAGNKVVNENGEIVEGIEIEERGESFSVKANE